MPNNVLEKLIEHNNWANDRIVQACLGLSDEQLDAAPTSATKGSIRQTLFHLVASQRGYYRLLTAPVEQRRQTGPELPFDQLQESARSSGEALLALVRDAARLGSLGRLETSDRYWVEPWVVLLQVINHATEHREQIKSLLTALGMPAPEIDGWGFGEATHSLTPVDKEK